MPTNPEREKDLIIRAQKGDTYAFEALIRENYMTIYKMAYRYIQHKESAEDIAQNCCVKLARAIEGFRFDSAFTSWLYRLVINTAKDWQKSQYRHNSNVQDENVETYEAYTSSSEQALYVQQVMDAIDALPRKERDAFILVTIEGYNHIRAAEQLRCSEGTISWRVHEARKKLKKIFKEDS